MWSFETSDFHEIERRVAHAGATLISRAPVIESPGLGTVRSLIVSAPDGFAVEIYERL